MIQQVTTDTGLVLQNLNPWWQFAQVTQHVYFTIIFNLEQENVTNTVINTMKQIYCHGLHNRKCVKSMWCETKEIFWIDIRNWFVLSKERVS